MKRISRKPGLGYRHWGRFGEIVSVMIKYGFGDLLSTLKIDRYTRIGSKLIPWRREKLVARDVSRWQRVCMALEELGPTFIKLGQFMSNRPDILPQDLILELERFQDQVAPFPPETARTIVEKELGAPVAELFTSFTEAASASASIAQVHRAVLRTGQPVAVKVQRPRIRDRVGLDIDILYFLAWQAQRHFAEVRGIDLMRIVEEFERAIRKEMDFIIEANQMERFAGNFARDHRVYVPEVFRELTTHKVITTEYVSGFKVSNVKEIREAGIDTRTIAENGTELVLKQVFRHGFFHADPHPGNIIIRADGSICFIDFGMMGIVSPSLREHLGAVMFGIVNNDSKRIVKTLLELSRYPVENIELLEYEVTELLEEYTYLSLRDYNIGDMLRRLMRIISEHRLTMMPGVFLLMKSMITIEGVGRRLDPDFNMVEHIEPFAKRMVRERFSPHHLAYDAYLTAMDFSGLMRDMPADFKDVIRTVKSGRMHIEFAHRGLEPMLDKHDQLVSRLVFSIVLAALIIGSSLIVLSGVPPTVNGIPLIGIIGFVVSGIIGFGLLWLILRRGKL
jgi:ubiquinone biosynthesis protein